MSTPAAQLAAAAAASVAAATAAAAGVARDHGMPTLPAPAPLPCRSNGAAWTFSKCDYDDFK